MSAMRLFCLAGILYAAAPLRAQFGEVLAVTRTPPGLAAVGLEHDGFGALLMTGIGALDTVNTVTPGGLLLAGFAAGASGNPLGVTTDGALLYVTDTTGPDVDVYTPAGAFLFSFPVATAFPEGITFDPGTGTLFVVDPAGGAMLEYTVAGAPLGVFPLLGTSPDDCAFDPVLGGCWVYDSGTDRVRHYAPGFVELESFPGTVAAGYGPGEGVAVIGATLYVAVTASDVVVAFDIGGGMPPGATATFTLTGTGCTDPAVVYESFPPGGFDLAGANVLFTPNGAGGYLVAPGPGPFVPPLLPPLAMGDDTVAPGLLLPFPFPHPGGTAVELDVSSNGFAWLGPCGNADPTPSVAEFLGQAPRLLPLWMDLDPSAAGSVHFDPAPGVALVTWLDVAEYGVPGSVNSVQLALFPGGAFEYRYLAAANTAGAAVTGQAPGPGALPGAADLSLAMPFDTGPGTMPLRLGRVARPVLGGLAVASVDRFPAGTALGWLVLGLVPIAPPIDLAIIGMSGCAQYVRLDITTMFFVSGPTALVSFPVPAAPAFAGVSVHAQGLTLSPGFTPLGFLSSNGSELVFGL